jgi:hypothetical protein
METKSVTMKKIINNKKNKKKLILLGVVTIVYLLVFVPILMINLKNKQETRGRAESTQTQTTFSAIAACSYSGNVLLGYTITNTDSTRTMNVIATDQNTGKSVTIGNVGSNITKTGTIEINSSSISSGNVVFSYTWSSYPSQTKTVTAPYTALACHNITKISTAAIGATCGNVPVDIVLVMDRSNSMASANKLISMKIAAKNFIDVMSQDSNNRIGLVSFSTTSTLNQSLTNNFTTVKNQVDNLQPNGYTCQECAITTANKEITDHGRQGIKKVVIMLTDGQANYIIGGRQSTTTSIAEEKAITAVQNGFNTSKTVFFTIGVGDPNGSGENKFYGPEFLKNIASLTGGKYYFPAPSELNAVYQEISQLIGKGLVGGFIFNDANGNGSYDQNESKLPNWALTLTSSTGSQSVTTDNSGVFTIPGLCDGSYTLKETLQSGWNQTLPTNPNNYAITITNASQYTDKNFGNILSRCSDNIDNDNNGYIDSKDSTCHTDGNPNNPNSYDPNKDGEHGGGNTCADSKDNNNNGFIDGADPVCHTDNNANNPNTYNPNLPEINPTPTPTAIPTLTPTPKPTLTPTPTVKITPTPTLTLTPTPTMTLTPTPTVVSQTLISLVVQLDGIGSRGDNANPTGNSLSNKNPLHKTKSTDIEIYDMSNHLVTSGIGSVTYNNSTGDFRSTLVLGNSIASGKYYLKVRVDKHLRKLIPSIQTINAGQNNQISSVALVAGDINRDNKLNILDYNMLLDCYSDLVEAAACTTQGKKDDTDINDDGFCNQIDYNLFIRELSTQPGE